MWQVLLGAAIAGSGYFAKQLLHKNDDKPTNYSPLNLDLPIENAESETSILEEDASSIFRFSSTSHGSKNPRKKLGRGGGIKGARGNHERKSGFEKKIGDGLVDDQRKNGKKFTVCLKKRRIGRNASAKCDSFDVKDKSSFGWGVGVGIMYMMSAGKAEIDKLNTAVDETAKVVQELKNEIFKRKSSRNSEIKRTLNQKLVDIKWDQSVLEKSPMENNDIESYNFPATDDAISMITEEPHQEVTEMDQLEAELESELLKLHISKSQDHDLESNQSGGVIPYELDQKLCHLLIEQQESQIVDLESELHFTNSKLLEKESELQALKDCVKRLTEFSLTCPSDEEREGQIDEAHNKLINGNGRSMVGIKRAIDFD
ncbi:protein POLAR LOCALIZATION DURING ASYMMETRIC DIVISION AND REDISTRIBUTION [Lactuca sativa]|uniref:Uncharacterized protein n=1 Tax=Lactuca sativa TaxID=4236 RepID=A0A9R1XB10_LACSA|nr:protein POLAR LOCALIZATION DURING ASYMMETRIC DIVISION AND REDISTRIBUTION [Lactuca sativa]KAJ0201917.1 hypothetical protein LSAT_V11C600310540 [Lactuca sativa]